MEVIVDQETEQLIKLILEQASRAEKSMSALLQDAPIIELQLVILRIQQVSFSTLAAEIDNSLEKLEEKCKVDAHRSSD
jgi:hypothetical protein